MIATEFFGFELSQIRDDQVRNLVVKIFNEKVPSYFMEIESSPAGDFHTNFNGTHNYLRDHVKSAVREFLLLITHPYIKQRLNEIQIDYCIAALLLHDCTKRGVNNQPSPKNSFENPITTAMLLPNYANDLEKAHFTQICRLMVCQKGPWTSNQYSQITLQEPYDDMTMLVHYCDWVASRKNTAIDLSDEKSVLDYIRRI